jgi:hypothetical protein
MPPTVAAIAYSASYGATSSRFGLLLEVEGIFSQTLTVAAPIGATSMSGCRAKNPTRSERSSVTMFSAGRRSSTPKYYLYCQCGIRLKLIPTFVRRYY